MLPNLYAMFETSHGGEAFIDKERRPPQPTGGMNVGQGAFPKIRTQYVGKITQGNNNKPSKALQSQFPTSSGDARANDRRRRKRRQGSNIEEVGEEPSSRRGGTGQSKRQEVAHAKLLMPASRTLERRRSSEEARVASRRRSRQRERGERGPEFEGEKEVVISNRCSGRW